MRHPHGLTARVTRGWCYRECEKIFNNKLRAYAFTLQKRYLDDKLAGLAGFVDEDYTGVTFEENNPGLFANNKTENSKPDEKGPQ
jgi:hypothetical protein